MFKGCGYYCNNSCNSRRNVASPGATRGKRGREREIYIYLRACKTFCARPKLEASIQMGRGESREQQRDVNKGIRGRGEKRLECGGCMRVIYANEAKDALPHLSGHCACL